MATRTISNAGGNYNATGAWAGGAVPVAGDAVGLDSVLAAASLVDNSLPVGSNWDGKSGLLLDEKTFKELVGGDPNPKALSQSQSDGH